MIRSRSIDRTSSTADLSRCCSSQCLPGGCAFGGNNAATPGGEAAVTYQYVPFDELDPQRVSDGQDVAGQNLLEGLVTPDAAGTGVVPATADTWTVSHDGTDVHLPHPQWRQVVGRNTRDRAGLRVDLPAPAQPVDERAERLNGSSGYQPISESRTPRVTSWARSPSGPRVGVKALDASHLRIVLDAPNATFLQGMAAPSMVALPQKNLKRFPYSWQPAARWVGNGPFVIKSWTPNSRMVLVPNEHYWDRKDVHLNRVNILMTSASDAQVKRQYQRHQVDIAGLGDPTGFEKDPALSPALTRIHQYSVNFLTLIPSRNPALRDVRVRRAIALGIGRAEVVKASPVVEPATSLVPSTLPGFDASVGFQAEHRRGPEADGRGGLPGRQGLSDPLHHDRPRRPVRPGARAHPAPEPRHQRRARHRRPRCGERQGAPGATGALRRLLLDRLHGHPGVAHMGFVELPAEPDGAAQPQARRLHALPGAAGAGNRAFAGSRREFLHAHASPQSRRFAAVAARAEATANPERATALYKQAAAIRQSTFEFIPYLYKDRVYAIRPGIKGVHLWTGYFTISFKGSA